MAHAMIAHTPGTSDISHHEGIWQGHDGQPGCIVHPNDHPGSHLHPHHDHPHGPGYLGTDGNGHDFYGGLLLPDFGHGTHPGTNSGTFVW